MDIDSLHAQVKALTGLNGMLLRKLVSKGVLTTDDAAEIVHGATGAMGMAHDAAAPVLKPVEELVGSARPED
jgi:hypothetical protein